MLGVGRGARRGCRSPRPDRCSSRSVLIHPHDDAAFGLYDQRNEFLMPQDKRVTDEARLNGPGTSAAPVGKLTGLAHRLSRTTDTNDLSASLRSSGRSLGVGSVLNLGEGGMLIEISSDLVVGEIVGFELAGPRFRSDGLPAVAHREDEAIGLRFETWEGSVDRSICDLVAARLRRGQLRSCARG